MKHEFQMGLEYTCLNPCRIFKNKHTLPWDYQRPLICSVFGAPFFLHPLTKDKDGQRKLSQFRIHYPYSFSLIKPILLSMPSLFSVWPGWSWNENANSFERESRAVNGSVVLWKGWEWLCICACPKILVPLSSRRGVLCSLQSMSVPPFPYLLIGKDKNWLVGLMWELECCEPYNHELFFSVAPFWKFWGLSAVKNGSRRGQEAEMLESGHIVGLSFLAPLWLGITWSCEWKRHIYPLDWNIQLLCKTPTVFSYSEMGAAPLAWSPVWLCRAKPSADSWRICSVIKKMYFCCFKPLLFWCWWLS